MKTTTDITKEQSKFIEQQAEELISQKFLSYPTMQKEVFASSIAKLIVMAKAKNNVIADPKSTDFSNYAGATL